MHRALQATKRPALRAQKPSRVSAFHVPFAASVLTHPKRVLLHTQLHFAGAVALPQTVAVAVAGAHVHAAESRVVRRVVAIGAVVAAQAQRLFAGVAVEAPCFLSTTTTTTTTYTAATTMTSARSIVPRLHRHTLGVEAAQRARPEVNIITVAQIAPTVAARRQIFPAPRHSIVSFVSGTQNLL